MMNEARWEQHLDVVSPPSLPFSRTASENAGSLLEAARVDLSPTFSRPKTEDLRAIWLNALRAFYKNKLANLKIYLCTVRATN